MDIKIREGSEGDAGFVAWTVLTALDMDDAHLQEMTEVCADPKSMYSWKNSLIAEMDGRPAGCLVSYPGSDYLRMREYTWPKLWATPEDLRVEVNPPETVPGEYYLDSMAIVPEARGKEIGHRLMTAAMERGKSLGIGRFSLIVDVGKPRLREYYAALGFRPVGDCPFFGHLYTRMQLDV